MFIYILLNKIHILLRNSINRVARGGLIEILPIFVRQSKTNKMTFSATYYRLSKTEKIEFLKSEMKFNKSRICRRAYWLIHNEGMDQSEAMKKCWKEAKDYRSKLAIELDGVKCEVKETTEKGFAKYMNYILKNK